MLDAIGAHWSLTRDLDVARSAVPVVAALVARLARPDDAADAAVGVAALPSVAEMLDAVGEPRAATDVRAVAAFGPVAPTAVPDLEELLATASPTWTWPTDGDDLDVSANAALLTAVRRLLVREVEDGLVLSPAVPDAWLGQGWEVHDVPTAEGRLAYAIRWHGDRPALLWELQPVPGRRPARLSVPSLDPSWSTTEPRGETLLAAVAVPERPSGRRGLTIPVSIEPIRRGPA